MTGAPPCKRALADVLNSFRFCSYAIRLCNLSPFARNLSTNPPRVCLPRICKISPLGFAFCTSLTRCSTVPPLTFGSNPIARAASAVASPTQKQEARVVKQARDHASTPLRDVKTIVCAFGSSFKSRKSMSINGDISILISPSRSTTCLANRCDADCGRVKSKVVSCAMD